MHPGQPGIQTGTFPYDRKVFRYNAENHKDTKRESQLETTFGGLLLGLLSKVQAAMSYTPLQKLVKSCLKRTFTFSSRGKSSSRTSNMKN